MKTKNMYTIKIAAMLILLLFCLFFINCESSLESIKNDISAQKDNNSLKTTDISKFLDVDVANLSNQNKEEMAIYNQARLRIDSFVKYDKNTKSYQLIIKNGSSINISERLFQHFKAQMNKSNEMLKEMENSKDFHLVQDIKDSKRLHIIKNK